MAEQEPQTYDVAKACAAQAKYLKDTGTPGFPPSNGKCWSCRKNIYEQIKGIDSYSKREYSSGISVEKAATQLSTGCPHCHRSFVD